MNTRGKYVWEGTLLLIWGLLPVLMRAEQPQSETTRWNVEVQNIGADQTFLDVNGGTASERRTAGGFDHLVVRDGLLKDQLKQLQKGDNITLVYINAGGQKELKIFSVDRVSVL